MIGPGFLGQRKNVLPSLIQRRNIYLRSQGAEEVGPGIHRDVDLQKVFQMPQHRLVQRHPAAKHQGGVLTLSGNESIHDVVSQAQAEAVADFL